MDARGASEIASLWIQERYGNLKFTTKFLSIRREEPVWIVEFEVYARIRDREPSKYKMSIDDSEGFNRIDIVG